MGLIEVNGMRAYAYHGCLPEEAVIGGHYVVDVAVQGDFSRAETADALSETVDYGRVAAIVQEQMAARSNLIEHVAARILAALKAEWPQHGPWRVRLLKERPPVASEVGVAAYVIEG